MMQAITISCSSERGFHRAGVFHPHGKKTWMPGELSEQQVEQITQEAQRPDSPLTVVTAEAAAPADSASAQRAALSLLRPFLHVPETQAQAALADLLHGGPEDPPPGSTKGEGKPVKKENKP